MEIINDWDEYFMSMVMLVSMKSKDSSTKIGAVIVNPENKAIVSTGYNDLPRGVKHTEERTEKRPEKYKWYEHGERNSIYNAARLGHSTEGCIMYTHGIPCADCARAVIQAGIKEVVIWKGFTNMREGWKCTEDVSPHMLKEAGVKVRVWSGKPVRALKAMQRGEELPFV